MNPTQWSDFLEQHNLQWSQISDDWGQGAFLGNGMMGAMIYKDAETGGDTLRWELGRCDVLAHFQFANIDWADPRVPIGDFLLTPVGKVTQESMELDLWNAEVRGTVTTDCGTIQWRSFIHAQDMVLVIDVETTGKEEAVKLEFRAKHGISPCLAYDYTKKFLPNDWWAYLPPYPKREHHGDITVSVQPFLKGGQCATAWQVTTPKPSHRVLYVSITNTYPEEEATTQALANVQKAISTKYERFIEAHQSWWHDYYPQSFVTLPDTRWEAFYWIQMYKLASATRADRALIDSQGPWLTKTPWPTCVWNLNVELSYMSVYTSNRHSLGESLCNTLDYNLDLLIQNVPERYQLDSAAIARSSSCTELKAPTNIYWEIGNLTWICHNYYRQCRYSMDLERMRNGLYPLLRRAVNYYLHLLHEDNDGKLHLPPTHSPEYGRNLTTRDANYDMALCRWGCQTLIAICDKLSIQDEKQGDWEDVLNRLSPPPVDENGLMVGRDLPFSFSHRHFSHLMGFFPLHVYTPDIAEDRALFEKSLAHWIGFEGALQGYSFTAASAMYATLGDGNKTLKTLNGLREFLTPNTMYTENGPVIETPLSAAESIHYMLLQSHGGVLRVFPAVPETWQDLAFENLAAEGGFLVSAVRKEGKTQFIRITSQSDEPCRLRCDLETAIQTSGTLDITCKTQNDGTLELDLKAGETVTLYQGSSVPDQTIVPLPSQSQYQHYYGMSRAFIAEQDLDGVLELPASGAHLHGETVRFLQTADKNKLGDWSNAKDWVTWDLSVEQPGSFKVLAAYACPPDQAGSQFTVQCQNSTLHAQVQETTDWETYHEIDLGEIQFTNRGQHQCELRAISITGDSLMDLHCLRLIPNEQM